MSAPGILEFDYRTGTPEEFARALFDRPIAATDEEKDALGSGPYDPPCGDATFVRLCTGLFDRFGELSAGYSDDRIAQGLWMVTGYPYFLVLYHLSDRDLPVELVVRCVRALYHPYADHLAPRAAKLSAEPLDMLWDENWTNASSNFEGARSEVVEVVFETLERILALPDQACRNAALHGLHHLQEAVGLPWLVSALDRIEERLGVTFTQDQREQLACVRAGVHPGG